MHLLPSSKARMSQFDTIADIYHSVSPSVWENDDRAPVSQAAELSARWRYTTLSSLGAPSVGHVKAAEPAARRGTFARLSPPHSAPSVPNLHGHNRLLAPPPSGGGQVIGGGARSTGYEANVFVSILACKYAGM